MWSAVYYTGESQAEFPPQPETPTDLCDNLLYPKCTCPSPHPQISRVCSGKCQKEIQTGYSHDSYSKGHLAHINGHYQNYRKRLITQKIIAFFLALGSLGTRSAWSGVYPLGRFAGLWYVISMVTRFVDQSLLSARWSFLPFKIESVQSRQPAPFLLHSPLLMLSTSSVSIIHRDVLYLGSSGIYLGE